MKLRTPDHEYEVSVQVMVPPRMNLVLHEVTAMDERGNIHRLRITGASDAALVLPFGKKLESL